MTKKRTQSHARANNQQSDRSDTSKPQSDTNQAPLSSAQADEEKERVTKKSTSGDQAVAADETAGDLVSHATISPSLPQELQQDVGQIDQLVVKLEQQLTQAMQPLLDSLLQEITETAKQQIDPAFEPVRQSLQQQIDQVVQPIHETLHREIDVVLQPVRETLQHEMDKVLQPVRETILQQVEIALRSSLKSSTG